MMMIKNQSICIDILEIIKKREGEPANKRDWRPGK